MLQRNILLNLNKSNSNLKIKHRTSRIINNKYKKYKYLIFKWGAKILNCWYSVKKKHTKAVIIMAAMPEISKGNSELHLNEQL